MALKSNSEMRRHFEEEIPDEIGNINSSEVFFQILNVNVKHPFLMLLLTVIKKAWCIRVNQLIQNYARKTYGLCC